MFKCQSNKCQKQFATKIGRGLHHNKCEHYKLETFIENKNKSLQLHKCICNKGFDTKNKLKGHIAKCEFYKDYINSYRKNLTQELLYDMYFIQNMSALQIAKSLNYPGTNAGHIIHILKEYGFDTRSSKDAANNSTTRKLYENTCLSKYGDVNVLGKNSELYHKRNQTVIEKYGVSNVFQSNEIKIKIREAMMNRYGVENPIYMPNRNFNNGRKSKIHIKVENILNELNIDYISECNGNRFRSNGYSPRPDIIIEHMKIVIEVNGDYWHANPNKYKPNDIICKWRKKTLAKEIWETDKKRINQIESFGYRVITLWEDFINKELNKDILCNLLKLNQLEN